MGNLFYFEYIMVNRADKVARAIHGTNPQRLIDYTVRKKIYDSLYWKKNCFGLSAEILIDKAMELKYIGGTYGGYRKPTEFICLVLKMLQIQLDDEIITELIKNEDFKYLRLLGAFYLRLTDIPIFRAIVNDYRKIRVRTVEGTFVIFHVDEIIDDFFRKDILFDTTLPRIQYRYVLQ